MNNYFPMDVMNQLNIIKSLENRSERTVRSLYVQAVLEYSLYQYEKNKLLTFIDQSLAEENKDDFYKYSAQYKALLDSYREGTTIVENGFELNLTFE